MLLGPSRVSHARSRCQIRVSVENILLILLRNPHVDRHDPADPAHPAPAVARPRTLTASRLRVPTTLDATELPAITAPEGKPRVGLRIRLPDRTVTAEIAAKSLRKAQTGVREGGADYDAFVLQGRLGAGDVIAEAELSAQPKAAKPAPQ